jgi:hypothetical protein
VANPLELDERVLSSEFHNLSPLKMCDFQEYKVCSYFMVQEIKMNLFLEFQNSPWNN